MRWKYTSREGVNKGKTRSKIGGKALITIFILLSIFGSQVGSSILLDKGIVQDSAQAASLPDLTITPILRSHTEHISSTHHRYQIVIDHDMTNHSFNISGPVDHPKVLNDDTPDFSTVDSIAAEVMQFARDNSELEKAKAVWRFNNEYFNADGPNPDPMHWNWSFINFFNSYGGSICGGTAAIGPQVVESIGLNGRHEGWTSSFHYGVYAEGDWRTFKITGPDVYFLGRDNESIVGMEVLAEDHWLMRRMSKTLIHAVSGDLGGTEGLSVPRAQVWWKASYDSNDPFGNNIKSHDMSFSLNEYESFQRYWMPADYFPKGMALAGRYPHVRENRTRYNLLSYQPDLQDPGFKQTLSSFDNIETYAESGQTPLIHAASAGQGSNIIFEIESPYSIYDAEINGSFFRNSSNDSLRVYGSVDNGETWKLLWEQTEVGEVEKSIQFNVLHYRGTKYSESDEHFSYLLKVEFFADTDKRHAGIKDINLDTHVIVYTPSLPALHQGVNQITFTADAVKAPIQVTHYWNEERFQIDKEIKTTTDPLLITLHVANEGEATSDSTIVRFYQGMDKLGDLIAEEPVPAIPPGGEEIIQVEIPGGKEGKGTAYAIHVLTAVIDPEDTLQEISEENNSAKRIIRNFNKQELMTIPEYVTYYEDSNQIKAVIWNVGDIAAKNFNVNIYEGSEESGPVTLLSSDFVNEIPRREHLTVTAEIDHAPSGIWVEIDPGDTVPEQFEKYGLVFSRGTQAPLVDIGPVRTAEMGQTIQFSPVSAIDPDGKSITSYTWEIDITSFNHHTVVEEIHKNGESVNHIFNQEGDYMIRLRVVDEDGEEAFDTSLIKIRGGIPINPVRGDLNQDEIVDDQDIHIGIDIILGFEKDQAILQRADLNQDGAVDIRDIQEITNIVLVNP
jgi:hypothetical protein